MGALSVVQHACFRLLGVAMLMGAGLAFLTTPLSPVWAHGAWEVYDLPVGEGYREGVFRDLDPEDRDIVRSGRKSMHVARVIPGQPYRLGLRLRSDTAKKLSVSLYDRWPYSEGARPIRLSTSGGLRGQEGTKEFQWWFSVDKGSPGSLLYIKVDVEPGFVLEKGDWSYQIFIVDSPRSPMNSLGRGVTYHRGPSNLKLLEDEPELTYRHLALPLATPVRHVDSASDLFGSRRSHHPYTGNLIRNGDFSEGLRHWRVWPERAEGVGVFHGKLRLWSRESSDASGVVQKLDIDVSKYRSLKLSLDLMISTQSEPVQGSGTAPLILSICYQDIRGRTHCGESAFRKQFSLALGDRAARRRAEVFPIGIWARYALDLNDVIPGLGRLISIGLFGSGAPEREAFISRIKIS